MTSPGGARAPAVLVVVGVAVLVVAHVAALYFGACRARLPVMIAGGVIALIVIAHLGLAGRVRSALRERAERRDAQGQ